MRKGPREGAEEREWARKELETHVMAEDLVRSFRFKREDGRSQYWFNLTWTPGHLALTGDIGELTLVHHHAMKAFEQAIQWAQSSDHDYLMSKTNARREYDPAGTLDFIIEWANEEPIYELNGRADRWWRRADGWKQGDPLIEDIRRVKGFRHELQAWRREIAQCMADGAPEEDWPERPYDDPNRIELKERWETEWLIYSYNTSLDKLYHIPEAWERWLRIWRTLRGDLHHPAKDAPEDGPSCVLTARHRRDLKDEMLSIIQDSQEQAVELMYKIGLEDYYGSERWPSRTYWQIAAIQHGCRMIEDSLARVEVVA